jgi:FkbM family methyltransferase
MKNIFLDCGTNLGQGLNEFISRELINDTFEIHCFEPNPHALDYSKKRFSDEKFKNYSIIFHEVALWIEEGKKTLTLEAFTGEYVCMHTGEHLGYDLKAGGASNIMGDKWRKPPWIQDNWLSNDMEVECIDFSDFLTKNVSKEDYVICKMDIEGAEFEIIPKLLKENTINLIDEIYIEWHDCNNLLIGDYDHNILVEQLSKIPNLKIGNWI